MEKNELLLLTCVDYTHDGFGVCKHDGYPIFVKDLLVGETGIVKLVKTKKSFGYGRLIELKEESPERVVPRCHIYTQCGGCQLQHLSAVEQNRLKKERVKSAFKKFAFDVEVNDVIAMDDPWFYRNKVAVPFSDANGEINYGFYKPRTHDIVPMDTCVIQNNVSNEILKTIATLIKKNRVSTYNEMTHKGIIRHVLTRYGFRTKELMVVFVSNEPLHAHLESMVQELVQRHPEITTVVLNLNNRNTNVILGEKEQILYGPGYIYDELMGLTFKISSKSFYQVNPIQTEKLYQKAIELGELSSDMIVLDTYCGIGTIGLSMAKHVKHVYGVEVNAKAIQDAKSNAELNGITNATFVCGDAATVMSEWKKELKPDVIFVDPPRKGCSEAFLNDVVEMDPKKIVYISCDVSTQARDVSYLQQYGYKTDRVQPVDLFPQTHHIESVLVLKK